MRVRFASPSWLSLRSVVLCFTVLAMISIPVPGAEPVESVVRIVNYQQTGDWFTPWDLSRVQPSVASGFVIEGGRVLTNAHAVSDSRLLAIFLHNDPEPHVATVLQIGHDCDLALVVPSEVGLLDKIPALGIGGLPRIGSTVETFGYPAGGSQVSSTIGVVSRIEGQQYVHSGADQHLAGQTDAAINPGNSGGPVVQDGQVVGVAFQAVADLQGVGYFIPTEVIGHFLADVADGRYDGYPDLGIQVATLQNEAERRREGLPERTTGVRVELIWPSGSAYGHLQTGDLVVAFEGQPIANDGSVLDGPFRIPFGLLVDRRQAGETVTLQVLRGGKRIDVPVPLITFAPAAFRSNAFDRLPRYYVYGGLVFVPLELETMKTFGNEWYARGDRALLREFLFRPLVEPELLSQERVVLLRRLDHPVNADMAWFRNLAVERVNGKPIHKLEDLIAAIESNTDSFHVIEFSNLHRLGVLDRAAADAAQAEILARYGVPKDRRL
jgi:S1-C subfamily serine protease